MKHADFVQNYYSGSLKVHVDRNKAGHMYDYKDLIPSKLRSRQAIIRAVAILGLIAGIVLFFFVKWWIATLILVFGLLGFPKAQQDAANGVLEASLQDKNTFTFAVNNNVLKFEDNSKVKSNHVDSQQIVKDYANTIERSAPLPLTVSDTKHLPYSKSIIKEAIINELKNTNDENLKGYLKYGYTLLANWQDNVGDHDVGINLQNVDLDTGNPKNHIKNFQKQSNQYNEWKQLIEEEEKNLKKELEQLGFS